MGNFRQQIILFLIPLFIGLTTVQKGYGQGKPSWYLIAGVGATALGGFNSSFSDLQYGIRETDASIDYRLNSKPEFLINGGVGLSGTFGQSGIMGWDLGLNIRSGGFRLTPELLAQEGQLSDFYQQMLPEFGQTKKFRYWAVHMPVSLTYLPFEYVGFKIGADLYYQFSSNVTDKQLPYGPLGETMGFTSHYAPKYQHPFQIGTHIGVFAPINERLRLDLDFFTDITPRLKVSSANSAGSKYNFREMGVRLNTRYYLK